MQYPELTHNSLTTLERRYLLKDEKGQPTETPTGMFERVANAIGHYSQTVAGRYFHQMRSLWWLPSSPILMNAGVERMGALAACYVLPVEDDIDEIFSRVKDAANITKQGGGIGYAFSRLRPSGALVASSGGKASGPVSFLRNFDMAAETVKQGGRRRAAQMGVLHVDHPDILEFIDAKANNTNRSLANFNLSVAITDAFMHAVDTNAYYDLINPQNGNCMGSLYAPDVWQRLAEKAWIGGDPGVVFIDRANDAHANGHLGTIETPNACSESFMLPWETCILGSVNLLAHLKPDGSYNWQQLGTACQTLTRFLDDVIDVSQYPLPAIASRTKSTRRIGVGVMGLADLLISMNIAYDSEQGVAMAGRLMSFVKDNVHLASQTLAKERGVYPAWVGSKYQQSGIKMRNTDPVVIAPTGTISIIAGVSSGIEPIFAREFERNVLDGARLVERHPMLDTAPQHVMKTAHEIEPIWHLRMQAAVQQHTDNAVSKTINMPHDATVDDIKTAYTLAYILNLRSVSIYRDGSKEDQVLVNIQSHTHPDGTSEACPMCAERLISTEGCHNCPSCGWSACFV